MLSIPIPISPDKKSKTVADRTDPIGLGDYAPPPPLAEVFWKDFFQRSDHSFLSASADEASLSTTQSTHVSKHDGLLFHQVCEQVGVVGMEESYSEDEDEPEKQALIYPIVVIHEEDNINIANEFMCLMEKYKAEQKWKRQLKKGDSMEDRLKTNGPILRRAFGQILLASAKLVWDGAVADRSSSGVNLEGILTDVRNSKDYLQRNNLRLAFEYWYIRAILTKEEKKTYRRRRTNEESTRQGGGKSFTRKEILAIEVGMYWHGSFNEETESTIHWARIIQDKELKEELEGRNTSNIRDKGRAFCSGQPWNSLCFFFDEQQKMREHSAHLLVELEHSLTKLWTTTLSATAV
jgi:hypothetical protein